MWVTSEPLNAEDAKSVLKSALKNLDDYIEKDQLEIIDANEWYTKPGAFDANRELEGWIEKEKEALKKGFDGLRLTGNIMWLEKKDWEKFADYEGTVNKVIGDHQMLGICSYYLEKCGASEIIDVVANHQFALIKREGEWGLIESSEWKKAEKLEKQNIQDLKYLSETAMGFMELPPDANIYLHIAENLKKLVGDSIVIVNSFDPETDLTCVRAVVGLGKLSKSALKILGRDPIGTTYKINELARHHLLSGKYHKVPGKMYELSFGQMPKPICYALEKLFRITEIHSMGFTLRGELLGNVVIILREGTELKNRKLVEAFINQAAVALQRKRAEEELGENEEKYRNLIEGSYDMVQSINLDGNFNFVNKAWINTLGFDENEVKKITLFDIIHPESLERCKKLFSRVISGESIKNIEAAFISKDGRKIIVEGNAVPRFLGDKVIATQDFYRDITERKKAEEALRKSEEKYRYLYEESSTINLMIGKDGIIKDVDKKSLEILGYKKDEVVGNPALDFIVPEQREKVVAHLEKDFKMEYTPEIDFDVYAKDGSIQTILFSPGAVLLCEEGQPPNILVTGVDITERKQAEKQIKHRLEFEKTVSNISSQFVGVLGFDEAINASLADLGRMSAASRAYLFLFRENKAIMDNTHEWCAEGVSPQIDDLKNLPSDMFPWWMKKLHNGEVIHIKDVSNMPTEAKAEQEILERQDIKSLLVLPLNIKGKLAGFIGFDNVLKTGEWSEIDLVLLRTSSEIIGNTLERKRAEEALREGEERFRLSFEEAPNGMALVGSDNKLLKVNKAFGDMLGYTREELTKLTFVDITHPEDIKKDVQFAEKLFKGEIPRYKLEKRYIKKNKEIVWVDLTATVVRDQNGKSLYGIGMVVDITERKLAEKEMKRRLMKFDLEDGSLYLVEEHTPGLSIEAFSDLLKVGYHGQVISRTPRRNFKAGIETYYDFRWIGEKGGEETLSPKPKDLEAWVEGLSRRTAILIDRLDYIISKNGFKKTLTLVHRLREIAYFNDHIIILSVDPSTLSEKELRQLEKEAMEIESQVGKMIPEDLLEVLGFVNEQNRIGIRPTYTHIGKELRMSKPTIRKRVRQLTHAGYVIDATKGRSKIVELTEKGRSLFFG